MEQTASLVVGKTYIKSGYDKNEVENGKYPNKKLQELVNERDLSYVQGIKNI